MSAFVHVNFHVLFNFISSISRKCNEFFLSGLFEFRKIHQRKRQPLSTLTFLDSLFLFHQFHELKILKKILHFSKIKNSLHCDLINFNDVEIIYLCCFGTLMKILVVENLCLQLFFL